MAKTDVKQAFRLLPVRKEDWPLLRIKWQAQYYEDKCLPFGLSSAPFLFNRTAEALKWILKHIYRVKHIIHYLDDFFIVEPAGSAQCQKDLEAIRTTVLGIPIAVEKTVGPTAVIVFLGIELDSSSGTIRQPHQKLMATLQDSVASTPRDPYYLSSANFHLLQRLYQLGRSSSDASLTHQ